MIHKVAGLLLAPLLISQGTSLRRTIPVLTEPEGPREGTVGNGSDLCILFVGDSAMAGVGAGTQDRTLYAQTTRMLAYDFKVTYRVEARTGARTEHTLRRLGRVPSGAYDVAVISLGVNDITGGVSTRTWIHRQEALIKLLEDRFGIGTVVLSGMPPVHGFPALPQPLRWVLGQQAKEYTRALERLARRRGQPFVHIDFTEDPALMADDGFHPGPEIYRMWSERVAERIGRAPELS